MIVADELIMSNFQLHVFSIKKSILLFMLRISVLCSLVVYNLHVSVKY
jgi:hypothetical protein